MAICGIYAITNKVNNKVYIGQSVDINERWGYHKRSLKNLCHHNIHLQNSWNKHGEDSFCFSILEEGDKETLNEKETHWISHYNALNRKYGYNLRDGGNQSIAEETKEKIRKSLTGFKHSEETIEKMKISQAGENNPMYGRHHSAEAKIRIINARRGWKPTEEQRRNLIGRNVAKGEQCYNTKLSDDIVLSMINAMMLGFRNIEIAEKFGVKTTIVTNIRNGYTWKHLTNGLDIPKSDRYKDLKKVS